MKAENGSWTPKDGFKATQSNLGDKAQVIFYFGSNDILSNPSIYGAFKERYPKAEILGCSTGGEILNEEVNDDTCVYMALSFDKTKVKAVSEFIKSYEDSYRVGEKLGKQLNTPDLRGVMMLSEGLVVNGSDLVKGMNSQIDTTKVTVSGGLAGDGGRFKQTLVGCNDNPQTQFVAAVGLYGDDIIIRTGSEGGWQSFGPKRVITQSKGNVLYELDGKPALELYKKYLGDEAQNLPGSALHFPLAIWPKDKKQEDAVIRTILSVNEDSHSMVFAGDVPEGYNAQLMWGKFDSIVDGAILSAREAVAPKENVHSNSVSIIISCIGRKSLMGQRIIDEIEQASKVLGNDNLRIGFYSYGEIAKQKFYGSSALHNQTMTITTFSEK